MRSHPIRTDDAAIDFAAIRAESGVIEAFPPQALAEAEAAAGRFAGAGDTSYPDRYPDRIDRRDIPLVTLDPAGSTDLDQAVHIAARDDGFRVRYAIADVAAFVTPGGALDAESHRRGMTLYCPDTRVPLYPPVLSEGAASLLPDVDRPAVLWTIDIDDRGEPVATDVRRSVVRSRAQLDYDTVQTRADVGDLHPSIALLPRVGRLRLQSARRRHAIDLNLPDPEVVRTGEGRLTLTRRATLPVEQYNAQISLLTGMCAAQLMLKGGTGVLRTLPPPDAEQIAQLRRSTAALGIDWPRDTPPGDVIAGLDAANPRHAAFIEDAIRLLRGAGYTPFDGAPPPQPQHGGLGAAYAHVTAPLRRLIDRYATEVCLALAAGSAVPAWARDGYATLPGEMAAATKLAREVDRACTQAVAERLLTERIGEVLTGMVVQLDRGTGRATILIDDPPVRVHSRSDGFTEGSRAAIRVTAVDGTTHRVDVDIVT